MALRLGLLGHQIAHSLSPQLHHALGRWAGIEVTYELIDVPDERFDDAIALLKSSAFDGFNVTAPTSRNASP